MAYSDFESEYFRQHADAGASEAEASFERRCDENSTEDERGGPRGGADHIKKVPQYRAPWDFFCFVFCVLCSAAFCKKCLAQSLFVRPVFRTPFSKHIL